MSWPQPSQYPGNPDQPSQSHPGYPPSQPSYGQQAPTSGQPYSGAGHPAPPTQPSYGYQQTPGQPGAGYSQQPGQAFPGPGVPPPPPAPPKKSNAGKIVLIALLAVLVLCGGGGALAYFALKDDVKGAVEAANTRVVAPDTLGGRPKLTDSNFQSLSDELLTGMKSDVPEATGHVGAFYGDPQNDDMVMIAAISGLIKDPAEELDRLVDGAGSAGAIQNIKSVDAGPLGGVAKCGETSESGIDMAVCFWADHGSLGVVFIYFTKADEAAHAEFLKIRSEVEKRS